MRKSFPAPKGLTPTNYASRYADSRKGVSRRAPKSKSLKKFLPSKKTLDLSGTSIKTTRSGLGTLAAIFSVALICWVLLLNFG